MPSSKRIASRKSVSEPPARKPMNQKTKRRMNNNSDGAPSARDPEGVPFDHDMQAIPQSFWDPPPDPRKERAVPLVRQQNSPVNPDLNGCEPEQTDDHEAKIVEEFRHVKGPGVGADYLLKTGKGSSLASVPENSNPSNPSGIGDIALPCYRDGSVSRPSGNINLAMAVVRIRTAEMRDETVSTRRLSLCRGGELSPGRGFVRRRDPSALENRFPRVALHATVSGERTGLVSIQVQDLENPEHVRDHLFHDDPRLVLAMVGVTGDGVVLVYQTDRTAAAGCGVILQLTEELEGRYGFSVRRRRRFADHLILGWDPDIRFRPEAEFTRIFSCSSGKAIRGAV